MYLLLFNILMLIPSSLTSRRSMPKIDENKIKFYLWNNRTQQQQINLTNLGNVTKSPTKFLIHGWLDAGSGSNFFYYGPVTQKYIKSGANVICVDWSHYSHSVYAESASYLRPVGELVARMVTTLNKRSRVNLHYVHIIGHSMGAHISGFAGKHIQEMTGGRKIDRITGLDPAGPAFKGRPFADRLYKTDAEKVDTVISDIFQFGSPEPLGHVNFYVYCGSNPSTVSLNHNLAPFYFAYGISKHDLIAKECKCETQEITTCKDGPFNVLGDRVDFKKPGNFYLNIDITTMMKDAKEAMASAPKEKFHRDPLNMIKNFINLEYYYD